MTDLLLGIDLGGTHVRTALVTRDKEVLRIDSRAAGVALERSEDA